VLSPLQPVLLPVLGASTTHALFAGGWTPLDLGASLLAWWTADRTDLISLSGSQVTAWADVKMGHTVTQAVSASRPMFSSSVFGGSPGVDFDGVDDALVMASHPFPLGASPCEIWAVAEQADSVVPGGGVNVVRKLLDYGPSGVYQNSRGIIRGTSQNFSRAEVWVGTSGSATFASLPAPSFFGRQMLRAEIGATSTRLTLDGVVGSDFAGVPATLGGPLVIGGRTNMGNHWKGPQRDVLITGPLGAEDAARLTTFAAARRNL